MLKIILQINKKNINGADFSFAGHTGYLAQEAGVKDYCMILLVKMNTSWELTWMVWTALNGLIKASTSFENIILELKSGESLSYRIRNVFHGKYFVVDVLQ